MNVAWSSRSRKTSCDAKHTTLVYLGPHRLPLSLRIKAQHRVSDRDPQRGAWAGVRETGTVASSEVTGVAGEGREYSNTPLLPQGKVFNSNALAVRVVSLSRSLLNLYRGAECVICGYRFNLCNLHG